MEARYFNFYILFCANGMNSEVFYTLTLYWMKIFSRMNIQYSSFAKLHCQCMVLLLPVCIVRLVQNPRV